MNNNQDDNQITVTGPNDTNLTSTPPPTKPDDKPVEAANKNLEDVIAAQPIDKPEETPEIPDDTLAGTPIAEPETQPMDQAPVAEKPLPQDEPVQDFSKIEVAEYNAPNKRPLASLEETLGERPIEKESDEPEDYKNQKVVNFRPVANAPMRADNPNRAVVISTTVAIIVLALGLAGGMGGYRYFQGQTASADTASDTNTTPTSTKTIDSTTPTTTTTTTTDAISKWTSYANTLNKYSIKFPDTWYSTGTESPTATTIQMTSFKPDASAGSITDGQKVEVVFQDTNGKTLSAWIEANNAAQGATPTKTAKTTVDTKEATQLTFATPIKNISTYLIHNDKVMMITYYAADKDFDKGITIYEDILNSIKLNP